MEWSINDPAPSSGIAFGPNSTTVDQEGEYTYSSSLGCDNAENCQFGISTIKLDTGLPEGGFTGNAFVIKFLNQAITGNANDFTSGVSKVEVISGTTVLSTNSGDIFLNCSNGSLTCTWSASTAKLSSGPQNITLKVIDLAGNVYLTTKQYVIL